MRSNARTTARTTARTAALAGATVLSLALAACGTDPDPMSGMDHNASTSSTSSAASSPAPSPAAVDAAHNAADVSFTQEMIVHHRGAVAMAELAPSRASSP